MAIPEQWAGQDGMEQLIRRSIAGLCSGQEGFFRMLDLRFEGCDWEARTLTLSAGCHPWMANPMGKMHGGIIAGLLDSTMGALSFYLTGGGRTPTVTMQTTYLRPVELTARVFIRASVVNSGRTLNHLSAEMWSEGREGRILNTAVGTYFATV